MLSYRHSFHAGNHADVLKHLVVTRILSYLAQKDKPLCYLDTHAGAGGYALDSTQAQKNREYETGIGRLWGRTDLPAPVAEYVRLVQAFNPDGALRQYPGSPWFARQLLRATDRLLLYELHSTDAGLLREQMAGDRRIKLFQEDGYRGCIARLPPPERRGLVLMDPPYELKSDYQQVVETLRHAHRRFASGVYGIWYPVVERSRIERLERAVRDSAIARVDLYELTIAPDHRGHGMTGSGLLVVNPPWRLRSEMETVLPYLAEFLADTGQGGFRVRELSGE